MDAAPPGPGLPALPRTADVIVVGGGAAGLMAGVQAAKRGRRTVLLEKNPRLGLKILISGGGRCNLTTTRSGRELEAEYGARRGRWLRHALRAFSPQDLIAWIEAAGVPLREEDLEKVFPVSGRARDVLDCLLRKAADAGVQVVPQAPMVEVSRTADGYAVHTPRGSVIARSLILATGGLSYPKTGSTGDGYRIARQLGHTMVPAVAHLAPLAVDVPWVRALAGVSVADAVIAAVDGSGAVLERRRRPILFTHKGLSGPGAMDLAGAIEEHGNGGSVRIDFAPDRSFEALERDWLAAARGHGRRSAANLLPRGLPERLRAALAAAAGAEVAAANLDRVARRRLLRAVKACSLPVGGSLGFAHAEVTRGGIPLDEVDPRTMASRVAAGLYLCGEILDVDGPIGGFNFQAAFATARLAGLHA